MNGRSATRVKPDKPKPDKRQLARQQKAGERAQATIQSYFLDTILYRSAVLDDRDPENLHQMRVGLRRLRTAMAVFEPVIELPKGVGDRRIAKMAKTLGAVRDLDVFLQWLSDYTGQKTSPKAERKVLEKVQKRLHKQRKKSIVAVQKLLQGKRYDNFVQAMEQWLRSPQLKSAGNLPLGAMLPDLLSPLICELLLHPGLWVATEGETSPQDLAQEDLVQEHSIQEHPVQENLAPVLQAHGDELHDLRKHMKQVRYQAEMFKDCYGRGYSNRIKEFKTLQAWLGDLQDEVVFNRFLTAALGPQWPKKLPHLAQVLQQQQQRRWREWQGIQQQYLDLAFRQKLRQMLMD